MQDATISVVHSTINRDIYTDRLPARAASLESPTFSWQLWKRRGKFEVDIHQKNQKLDVQNKTIHFAKNVCHFYRIALAKCFPHAIFRSVFSGYVYRFHSSRSPNVDAAQFSPSTLSGWQSWNWTPLSENIAYKCTGSICPVPKSLRPTVNCWRLLDPCIWVNGVVQHISW